MLDKILPFPKRSSKVQTAVPQDLSFMDGALSLPNAPAPVSQDWTNEELAQLYRVQSLILQAGLQVISARGLTDEGDPWFAYSRPNNEVFVHLARIGREYLIDSPVLGGPVYAFDFEGLVKGLEQKLQQSSEQTSNLVMLGDRRHGGRVRLHPAVTLTAVVWTLYLLEEDGSMPLPLLGPSATADFSDIAPLETIEAHDAVVPAAQLAQDTTVEGDPAATRGGLGPAIVETKTALGADGRGVTIPVLQNGTLASVMTGLVGTGFVLSQYMPFDAGTLLGVPDKTQKNTQAEHNLVTEKGQARADADTFVQAREDLTPADMVAADVDPMTQDFPTLAIHEMRTPDVLPGFLAPVEMPEETQAVGFEQDLPVEAPQIARTTEAAPAPAPKVTKQAASLTPQQKADPVSSVSTKTEVMFPATLKTSFEAAETLQIDDVAQIIAPVQMAEDQPQSTLELNADTPKVTAEAMAPSSVFGSEINSYTAQVQDFLFHLLTTVEGVEIFRIGDEVVIADMVALDDMADTLTVRSWVMEENNLVISTIGQASEYVENGIA